MGFFTVLGRRRAAAGGGNTLTASGIILDWDAVNGVTTGTLVQNGSFSATTTPNGTTARRYTGTEADQLRISPLDFAGGSALYVLLYAQHRNAGSFSFALPAYAQYSPSGFKYYTRLFNDVDMNPANPPTTVPTVATAPQWTANVDGVWGGFKWSFLPTSSSPNMWLEKEGTQIGAGADSSFSTEPPAIDSASDVWRFGRVIPMDLARIVVCTDPGNWDTYAPAVYGA